MKGKVVPPKAKLEPPNLLQKEDIQPVNVDSLVEKMESTNTDSTKS